jgi:predicted SnoaL-like aldol condensation-catalyzing enzyme
MSTEQNKALIRRFYEEAWGKGNVNVADEVFAADYVRHDLRPGNPLPGPAGQKQIATFSGCLSRSSFYPWAASG